MRRFLGLLLTIALLAGCGGGASGPARERVEQDAKEVVKHCRDHHCGEAEGQRLLGEFYAACKEAPNFVLHVPGQKDEACKQFTEGARTVFPAQRGGEIDAPCREEPKSCWKVVPRREVRRRVREERLPTFTGPNGKPLPPAQAAAAARGLEAQCRKQHEPCTALGGVVLSTKRYKVQIK